MPFKATAKRKVVLRKLNEWNPNEINLRDFCKQHDLDYWYTKDLVFRRGLRKQRAEACDGEIYAKQDVLLEQEAKMTYALAHIRQSEMNEIMHDMNLEKRYVQGFKASYVPDSSTLLGKYYELAKSRTQEPESIAHWPEFRENYIRRTLARGFPPVDNSEFLQYTTKSFDHLRQADDINLALWFSARNTYEALRKCWEKE